MKVYMFVDMEGISGIYTHREDHDEEAQRLQTHDVNAAIEGALEGGATEILVQIAHGKPRPFELHPKARYMNRLTPLCLQGMDKSFACMLHIGCHARAGAQRGVLAHTVEVEISEQRLNGVLVGECGIFAAMAGQFGVPTTLVTGDDVTCAEARDLLGDIEVAEVKRGLGWNQAICLPLAETAALIRARAAAAVRRSREIKPYRVEPPFVIRTAYNTWEAIMKADRRVSGTALAQRVDERTVEIRSDNLTEAFNLSW